MTNLSEERVDAVCRVGQDEATCAFLMFSSGGYECAKGSALENTLRQIQEAGSMQSQGDNCSGPPTFEPTEDSHQLAVHGISHH